MALVSIILAIICLSIASCIDLRARWSPDYLSFFLIAFGLGNSLLASVLQKSFWPVVYALVGFGIFLVIALVMFYSGAWGGGDAKFIMALGVLFASQPGVAPWPFLLTLFLNILLFGALFGILGSVYLAVRNWKKFRQELDKLANKYNLYLKISFSTLVIPLVLLILKQNFFLMLAWLAYLLLIYLLVVMKAVENSSMFKLVKPSQMMEGDWVVDEIKIGGFHYKPSRTGIEKKYLEQLIKLEKEGKISRVKVKDGLPYLPGFLVGLLASIFYGDLMFKILVFFV